MNNLKTVFLMVLMTGLLLVIGSLIAGRSGLIIMFIVSMIMNFFSYWYSDKMVLKAYQAMEVTSANNPELINMVRRLANNAGLPMPRVYIIHSDVPNAFATGRSPSHAAVAVSTGIMELLDDNEIEGVLGHELTHIKHRDTLIGTVAATMAGVIAMVANLLQWTAIFGSRDEDGESSNIFVLLATIILAPIAASLIQMGISRSREYLADEGGAEISQKPLALASALAKIDYYSKYGVLPNAQPSSAHMFIINPFTGHDINFRALFSTHPSTASRIAKLKEMALQMHVNQ